MSGMDTMTFFKLFIFLLVVGTLASMIGEGDINSIGKPTFDFSNSTMKVANTTANGNCYTNSYGNYVCDWQWPFLSQAWDLAASVVNLVIGFAQFLLNLGGSFVKLIGFFTGLTTLFDEHSTLALPTPFNWIVGSVVFFMWIFLVIEIITRIKNMFLPGGG